MTKDRRNGLYGLIAQVMAENPEISAGRTMSGIRRYGPWQCKHRPAGDWVIDQLDRQTLKVRRFGTFKTEAEAREIYAVLTGEVSPNGDYPAGQDNTKLEKPT